MRSEMFKEQKLANETAFEGRLTNELKGKSSESLCEDSSLKRTVSVKNMIVTPPLEIDLKDVENTEKQDNEVASFRSNQSETKNPKFHEAVDDNFDNNDMIVSNKNDERKESVNWEFNGSKNNDGVMKIDEDEIDESDINILNQITSSEFGQLFYEKDLDEIPLNSNCSIFNNTNASSGQNKPNERELGTKEVITDIMNNDDRDSREDLWIKAEKEKYIAQPDSNSKPKVEEQNDLKSPQIKESGKRGNPTISKEIGDSEKSSIPTKMPAQSPSLTRKISENRKQSEKRCARNSVTMKKILDDRTSISSFATKNNLMVSEENRIPLPPSSIRRQIPVLNDDVTIQQRSLFMTKANIKNKQLAGEKGRKKLISPETDEFRPIFGNGKKIQPELRGQKDILVTRKKVISPDTDELPPSNITSENKIESKIIAKSEGRLIKNQSSMKKDQNDRRSKSRPVRFDPNLPSDREKSEQTDPDLPFINSFKIFFDPDLPIYPVKTSQSEPSLYERFAYYDPDFTPREIKPIQFDPDFMDFDYTSRTSIL